MKETIYTIPLSESLEQTELCPFCFLKKKLEAEMVDYCIGPSMMEPDSRETSNKTGFCRRHLDMMLEKNNRLSLALMLSTHLEHVRDELSDLSAVCTKKSGLFKKNSGDHSFDKIDESTSACVICKKIDYDMSRYIDTFIFMYAKDADFKKKFSDCGKLCVTHGIELLKSARQDDIKSDISKFLVSSLDSSITELKAFIDMFDYRSEKSASPGAHKDAVPDAIAVIRS